MSTKVMLTVVFVCLVFPAAFCWEYNATFDSDPEWTRFDDDTGAGTPITQGEWNGVMSVPYPNFEVRYIFLDGNSPGFGPNYNLEEGYVKARVRWSGAPPTIAYFFLAGGGDAGDNQIYLTSKDGGWQGGTQTFWQSKSELAIGPDWTTIGPIYFGADTFEQMNVGRVHDSQRGTPDSWATTIASVDAVGIVLGYFGTTPGALEIDEFRVTPEPSILLLSGPLAGFLGWKIRRRGRRSAARA